VKNLNLLAQVLLIIGGLNWGLMGLFQFDLVAAIFGGPNALLARVVYILVGAAALYGLTLLGPLARGSSEPRTVVR